VSTGLPPGCYPYPVKPFPPRLVPIKKHPPASEVILVSEDLIKVEIIPGTKDLSNADVEDYLSRKGLSDVVPTVGPLSLAASNEPDELKDTSSTVCSTDQRSQSSSDDLISAGTTRDSKDTESVSSSSSTSPHEKLKSVSEAHACDNKDTESVSSSSSTSPLEKLNCPSDIIEQAKAVKIRAWFVAAKLVLQAGNKRLDTQIALRERVQASQNRPTFNHVECAIQNAQLQSILYHHEEVIGWQEKAVREAYNSNLPEINRLSQSATHYRIALNQGSLEDAEEDLLAGGNRECPASTNEMAQAEAKSARQDVDALRAELGAAEAIAEVTRQQAREANREVSEVKGKISVLEELQRRERTAMDTHLLSDTVDLCTRACLDVSHHRRGLELEAEVRRVQLGRDEICKAQRQAREQHESALTTLTQQLREARVFKRRAKRASNNRSGADTPMSSASPMLSYVGSPASSGASTPLARSASPEHPCSKPLSSVSRVASRGAARARSRARLRAHCDEVTLRAGKLLELFGIAAPPVGNPSERLLSETISPGGSPLISSCSTATTGVDVQATSISTVARRLHRLNQLLGNRAARETGEADGTSPTSP